MIDIPKAESWASEKDNLLTLAWKSVNYLAYRIFPRFFQLEISLPNLFFGSISVLCSISLISLPFLVEYFLKKSYSSSQMISLSLIIVVLTIYPWLYSKISNSISTVETKKNSFRTLALHESQVNSKLSEYFILEKNPQTQPLIALTIKDILICIEHKTRIILREYEATYFQVTLLLFSDISGSKIEVFQRANSTRPTGTIVDSSHAIAYYVAKAKKTKVLNDLKKPKIFPNRGLSLENAPYRSILFIPLIFDNCQTNSREICKGVLTIDSSRPYEFWADSENLVEQLQSLVCLLKLFLKDHPYGI